MENQKMFAILETSYEYDDNYYNASEGYNRPKKIFRSEEKAEEFCRQANEEFLMEYFNSAYIFGSLEDFVTETGVNLLKEMTPVLSVHGEVEFNPEERDLSEETIAFFRAAYKVLPEDKRKILLDSVQVKPFSVHEVLVEE